MSKDLQDAWVEILGRVYWDWYMTLTFRDEVHPEAADKRFRILISMANRSIYGPRWSKKGEKIVWARVIEVQRRGVIHFHALLSGVSTLNPHLFKSRWNELSGYSKIETPRRNIVVCRYISKFVNRGSEIDIGGPWPSFEGTETTPLLPKSRVR